MKKIICFILIFIILTSLFTACGEKSKPKAFDIKTAKIGVMTGATGEFYVNKNLKDAKCEKFSDIMSAVAALKIGKVEAVITADVTARNIAKSNPDLEALLDNQLTVEPVCVATSKKNKKLFNDIDKIIGEFKKDGTMDDIVKRFIKNDNSPAEPVKIPTVNGEVLKIGLTANREPFEYISNDELIGIAPELALRIGQKLGRKIEFVDMEFAALISALQSGKVDVIVSLIVATEERRKAVDFTQEYYTTGQVVLKKKDTLTTKSITSLEQLKEKGVKIGVAQGAASDYMVREQFKNAEVLPFNSLGEGFLAVKTGKIAAFSFDKNVMEYVALQNPELMLLDETIGKDPLVVGLKIGNNSLLKEINVAIDNLKTSGIIDEMQKRWSSGKLEIEIPNIKQATNPTRTIIVGTSFENPPMNYLDKNGNPTGFDVELAKRLSKELNAKIEIKSSEWSALIPSLNTNKIDLLIANLNATKSVQKSLLLSKPYVETYVSMLVKKPVDFTAGTSLGISNKENIEEKTDFWREIKKSFYNNLIIEDRYKMVFEGLGITIIISIFSLILGTLLGFLICFLNMSKIKLFNFIAKVYLTLLRGTPMVVLLMITYYIIFAKVNINPILVAIIAFGLNGGAFIGEIIRTAILTIDKGQIEAARSMGFSKMGAFLIVTLPQAVRVAMPVYKSEFISLVKSTAIVGYIAIVDLTKVGDIIRSRTYDAFFPLIVVAIVYLITTGIFIAIFDGLNRATDKRLRRGR